MAGVLATVFLPSFLTLLPHMTIQYVGGMRRLKWLVSSVLVLASCTQGEEPMPDAGDDAPLDSNAHCTIDGVECQAGEFGEWSPCQTYELCGGFGERTRETTRYHCVSTVCVSERSTETRGCDRGDAEGLEGADCIVSGTCEYGECHSGWCESAGFGGCEDGLVCCGPLGQCAATADDC